MITQLKLSNAELSELRKGIVKDLIKNGVRQEVDEVFTDNVKSMIKDRVEQSMKPYNLDNIINNVIQDVVRGCPETKELIERIKGLLETELIKHIDIDNLVQNISNRAEYQIVKEVKQTLRKYELVDKL